MALGAEPGRLSLKQLRDCLQQQDELLRGAARNRRWSSTSSSSDFAGQRNRNREAGFDNDDASSVDSPRLAWQHHDSDPAPPDFATHSLVSAPYNPYARTNLSMSPPSQRRPRSAEATTAPHPAAQPPRVQIPTKLPDRHESTGAAPSSHAFPSPQSAASSHISGRGHTTRACSGGDHSSDFQHPDAVPSDRGARRLLQQSVDPPGKLSYLPVPPLPSDVLRHSGDLDAAFGALSPRALARMLRDEAAQFDDETLTAYLDDDGRASDAEAAGGHISADAKPPTRAVVESRWEEDGEEMQAAAAPASELLGSRDGDDVAAALWLPQQGASERRETGRCAASPNQPAGSPQHHVHKHVHYHSAAVRGGGGGSVGPGGAAALRTSVGRDRPQSARSAPSGGRRRPLPDKANVLSTATRAASRAALRQLASQSGRDTAGGKRQRGGQASEAQLRHRGAVGKLQAHVQGLELRLHGQSEALRALEQAVKLKDAAIAAMEDDLKAKAELLSSREKRLKDVAARGLLPGRGDAGGAAGALIAACRAEADLRRRVDELEGALSEAKTRASQARGRATVLAESLRSCQAERKAALAEAAEARVDARAAAPEAAALQQRLAFVQKALGEERRGRAEAEARAEACRAAAAAAAKRSDVLQKRAETAELDARRARVEAAKAAQAAAAAGERAQTAEARAQTAREGLTNASRRHLAAVRENAGLKAAIARTQEGAAAMRQVIQTVRQAGAMTDLHANQLLATPGHDAVAADRLNRSHVDRSRSPSDSGLERLLASDATPDSSVRRDEDWGAGVDEASVTLGSEDSSPRQLDTRPLAAARPARRAAGPHAEFSQHFETQPTMPVPSGSPLPDAPCARASLIAARAAALGTPQRRDSRRDGFGGSDLLADWSVARSAALASGADVIMDAALAVGCDATQRTDAPGAAQTTAEECGWPHASAHATGATRREALRKSGVGRVADAREVAAGSMGAGVEEVNRTNDMARYQQGELCLDGRKQDGLQPTRELGAAESMYASGLGVRGVLGSAWGAPGADADSINLDEELDRIFGRAVQ